MIVLMIGTKVPVSTEKFCFSKGVRTSAADSVQNYMLHGIEEIDEIEFIDAIGSVRLKAWPRSCIFRLENSLEKSRKGTIQGVGYTNLPVLGFLHREFSIVAKAKKWAKVNQDENNVIVLVYSMHSPFLKAAKAVKKAIPSACVVLTVADLPLYMDMRGTIRTFLKKVDWYQIKSLMSIVDKYLLYTRYMAEYLDLPENKWMVFEGLIDEKRIVKEQQEKYQQKICLYAGNLDPRYGIDMLIESFKKVKSDAKLYIYGAGFDSERVASLVASIKNVEYKGQVTPDEIFDIMKKATLLINPRPATIGLAKYSCPSKTFEYMASGTPVLMNKLPGIPDEYEPYLYFFNEESTDGYAASIDMVLSSTEYELIDFGQRAASFLKLEKNSKDVMQRVYKFIER